MALATFPTTLTPFTPNELLPRRTNCEGELLASLTPPCRGGLSPLAGSGGGVSVPLHEVLGWRGSWGILPGGGGGYCEIGCELIDIVASEMVEQLGLWDIGGVPGI